MSENIKDILVVITILAAVALIFIVGAVFGAGVQEKAMQKKAVISGVAHWEVNEAGETKFVWNREAAK